MRRHITLGGWLSYALVPCDFSPFSHHKNGPLLFLIQCVLLLLLLLHTLIERESCGGRLSCYGLLCVDEQRTEKWDRRYL